MTQIKLVAAGVLVVGLVLLLLSQNATPANAWLFNLKRSQEKVILGLKPGPETKFEYLMNLQNIRLNELETVVNNGEYSYVLSAASRYSTFAGQLVEFLKQNGLSGRKDAVEAMFAEHKNRLWKAYVIFPKNTADDSYKFIEDDINYLDLYQKQLEN